jgi:hypothetical protein
MHSAFSLVIDAIVTLIKPVANLRARRPHIQNHILVYHARLQGLPIRY